MRQQTSQAFEHLDIMGFTFIHAADLHIDSPLAGLRLKDGDVAQRFANAGRRAVEALIAETIASKAAFLIIAGDVFDGDWKDVNTGLFFVRAISELHRAGIPVFMVKGNHDAESLMSRDLDYPDTVKVFRSDKAETVTIDAYRVALHGRSFPTRLTGEFVGTYPVRSEGWLNVGVLHTSLDGTRGHIGYAPCTVDDLKRFGYDYWALGHIHAAEIVSCDPWIVFPGNLQGRSVRETGARGAMRVTVEDGRIVDVTPVPLDVARWAHLTVDVASAEREADVVARIAAELAGVHAQSEGRPLAVRVTLVGATALHNHLVARRDLLQDDVRASGFQLAADCWVEQVKVKTTLPSRPPAALSVGESLDVNDLLAEAAHDPEFAAVLAELTEAVKAKLPKDLHDEFSQSDTLQALADDARALLAGELS
jgi:DNA repair exonuclease SbcCD nuclease subunit